jgi:hypothetical protein
LQLAKSLADISGESYDKSGNWICIVRNGRYSRS